MIWKYRPYDGGLDKALAKTKIFWDDRSMFIHCVLEHSEPIIDEDNGEKVGTEYPFGADDLYISEKWIDDKRINWPETHYIMTRRYYDELDYPLPVGLCCPYDDGIISKWKDWFYENCRLLDYPPEIQQLIEGQRLKEILDNENKK